MTREDTVQEDTIQWDTIWKGNMMRGYNTRGYTKKRRWYRCLKEVLNLFLGTLKGVSRKFQERLRVLGGRESITIVSEEVEM